MAGSGSGKRKRKRRHRSLERSRERAGSPPDPHRLLVAAALGDRRRCRSLLKRGVPAGYADPADGTTALHEACRHGHLRVAQLLLRRGADAAARDARRNTPAHLAARAGHLALLSGLLKSDTPPDVDAANAEGRTVRQLAAAALVASEHAAAAEERRARRPAGGGGGDYSATPSADGSSPAGSEGWRQRLAGELSEEEGGFGEDAGWGAAAETCATADDWARHIWEGMQAKRRAAAAAETSEFWRKRREELARRQASAHAAQEESRRILEEERRKDAEWRRAVAQGDAGAKRASYEARWGFFAARPPEHPVRFDDVPWALPDRPEAEGSTSEELRALVLYGASTPEERRRRLRSEQVRWHPDKFEARFGRRLDPGHRERVLARVNALSQALNALAEAEAK